MSESTPTWQNIMNEVVPPRVRAALRDQIVERTAISENNRITLSLLETQGLPNGQMVLCIEHDYELRSLRSESVAFEVQYYLDEYIASAKTNLPQIELVEIGSTNYSGSKLMQKVKDGVFSVTVDLQPGYEGSTRVRTKRREEIYVPGSYNLVMNELCAGVSIDLDQIPPGIVASVRGPHATKPVRLRADEIFNNFQEQIVLPGQGFEFRFMPEVAAVATPILVKPPRAVQGHFIEIESPTDGANVKDGDYIRGTANLPPNSFLWILVGGAATCGWWRSLGNAVDVKGDLTWEVPAVYGRAADTGSFEIFAIVVDQRAHDHSLLSYAKAGIAGKSMDLPRPIDDGLVKRITVEKRAIQLDRFNVERRGSVLADRRVRGGDRRNRQAG
jgi:hypothetical protein